MRRMMAPALLALLLVLPTTALAQDEGEQGSPAGPVGFCMPGAGFCAVTDQVSPDDLRILDPEVQVAGESEIPGGIACVEGEGCIPVSPELTAEDLRIALFPGKYVFKALSDADPTGVWSVTNRATTMRCDAGSGPTSIRVPETTSRGRIVRRADGSLEAIGLSEGDTTLQLDRLGWGTYSAPPVRTRVQGQRASIEVYLVMLQLHGVHGHARRDRGGTRDLRPRPELRRHPERAVRRDGGPVHPGSGPHGSAGSGRAAGAVVRTRGVGGSTRHPVPDLDGRGGGFRDLGGPLHGRVLRIAPPHVRGGRGGDRPAVALRRHRAGHHPGPRRAADHRLPGGRRPSETLP